MALFIGLVVFQAWISMAAPYAADQNRALDFDEDVSSIITPSPILTGQPSPPFVPTPLALKIGGIHTLPQGENPFGRPINAEGRGAERRDVLITAITNTPTEKSHFQGPKPTPFLRHIELRATPPPPPHPLSIPVADAHPLVPIGQPVQPRDAPFTPPPPAITNAGVHFLEPPGIPIADQDQLQERNTPAVAPGAKPKMPATKPAKAPAVPVAPGQPPDGFVPPPPHIVNAGVHTLGPIAKRQPNSTGSLIPQGRPTFTTLWAQGTAIAITEQRQSVTTFAANVSCEPTASASTGPFNSVNGSQPSCTTSFIPVVTSICATAVTPLAAPPIAITDCDQYVTYSSQYGYAQLDVNATAAPTGVPRWRQAIQTVTTYYAAVWTDVNPGVKPTQGIVVKCDEQRGCSTSTYHPATSFPSWSPIETWSSSATVETTTEPTVSSTFTETLTTAPTPATSAA
ncbi:uncharacterized protein KY384_001008 [Bacidia gigantensis]|uniref:uncharacterized protein n=1 Tax=Bacidia gigantensis TaxID=2732470 RepID=UPI001D03ECAB|nr:uncharacterized protein KY384_001008 [Bacidia gigantensis]KAG8534164.1 hypothetical protein KY384_001008 [Bacidia gigantensis]